MHRSRAAQVSVPLRWRDLDYQGHVYHGVMLTLLDEGRTKFFGGHMGLERPDAYVVVRIELDYLAETLHSNGPLGIDFEIVRLGRTSLITRETVTDALGSRVAAALTTSVLWDQEAGAPRAILDEERRIAAAYMVADAGDANRANGWDALR